MRRGATGRIRILDVSPRMMSGNPRGSVSRITGILGPLAERHEVAQFAQARPTQRRTPSVTPWPEHVHRSRISGLVSELGERTWPTAPVFSGAGLAVSRPRRLAELLRWADAVLVEFPWQVAHCRRRAPDTPLVLATHNVEIDKFATYAEIGGASLLTHRPWLRYIERTERRALDAADAVLTVSERDRDRLAELYGVDPGRVVVAPNGADMRAIRPADRTRHETARRELGLDGRPAVLYMASDTTPNRQGLDWVRTIARETDRYAFVVVGPVGGRPRREGDVRIEGRVDDIRLYLDAADISLCPKEAAAGTKIKVIEALAAGLPTVAFPESLAGLHVRDGEHALSAPKSAEDLLAALDRLADDEDLRRRMGAAARTYAVEHHDWLDSARAVEELLLRLVAEGTPDGGSGMLIEPQVPCAQRLWTRISGEAPRC